MPGRPDTRKPPPIEPEAEATGEGTLSAVSSLRLHWPEYLMEAGESGLYLFSACAVATLLWHPASPVQPYLATDAVRRMLMGLAMGATIMAIVLSPWGKQSGAHFDPAVTLTFYRLRKMAWWDAVRTFGPALYGRYWHALWIYFAAPPLGMAAAAEGFLLARDRKGPYCAKLNNHNDKRCIFQHSGPDPTAPNHA